MSIEAAEQLKREWTDQYVQVKRGVPELRRFEPLTGQVKTVNMNCKALVQFISPEDISWYDIDPAYLVVVDKPTEKKQASATEKKPEQPKAKPAAASGLSPLEQARQQGAGNETTASAKPLSPLEQARQQGAGGAATPAAEKPAAKPAAGLSPLERPASKERCKKEQSLLLLHPQKRNRQRQNQPVLLLPAFPRWKWLGNREP